ncbi:Nuclear transcription factor Y subunit B-3 [Apostasia shenzhenica]|uniref:Nuclear transcription factor Y subunit B-3 n=1 Tax=Apostasia shenzhenica TaxID=1088818 RepID=A0A2I0AY78_9ASPA|nr:Nuclear transcription factor Y subunit B-3 [Apostasia shenzhenica]
MKGRKGTDPQQLLIPTGSPQSDNDAGLSKEQDRFLPIANVSRIMKRSLPANVKISKDAKETVQECVSEFISFITGEASDKCQREKRKTINGDDLLWAMTTLGFDSYVVPLKTYLNRYRETEGEKNTISRQPQPADHDQASLSEDGSGAAAAAAATVVDGGFYSELWSSNHNEKVGGHGLFGRTAAGNHPGGRAAVPSHLRGADQW